MSNSNFSQNEQYVQEENKAEHHSYVHTEVRAPHPLSQPHFVTNNSGLAQELVGEGFHASISRFTGASQESQIYESPKLLEEAQRDYDSKQKEQEVLRQAFEKELERRTEMYRVQAEVESEKIRKELEKQHVRDVEFRKQLADLAVENQKKQIDIESRYAKLELDRQRQMARESLERTKFNQQIEVNLDSAAGHTQSGASTIAESEKQTNS